MSIKESLGTVDYPIIDLLQRGRMANWLLSLSTMAFVISDSLKVKPCTKLPVLHRSQTSFILNVNASVIK